MKRQMMACFYMCVTSILFASDATIEKVDTFERGDKTSVVITYSGAEKLRFFALDSSDGVFTLDLPGVYSHFDFSSLTFSQVTAVKQVPLDPDVSNGISVRFFLRDGASYDVFESGANELTLFFEGVVPQEAVAANESLPSEPLGLPAVASPASAPVFDFQKSLTGPVGDGRLYEVSVDASLVGGKLLLRGNVEKYTHFFLDNPKRFVLDLRDTILSLPGNDLDMDHPLVNRVRIRQFQSHPEPITRLVLDLAAETHVSVFPTEVGLTVVFAQDIPNLTSLLEEAHTDQQVVEQVQNKPDDVRPEPAPEMSSMATVAQQVADEPADTPDTATDLINHESSSLAVAEITESPIVPAEDSSQEASVTAEEAVVADIAPAPMVEADIVPATMLASNQSDTIVNSSLEAEVVSGDRTAEDVSGQTAAPEEVSAVVVSNTVVPVTTAPEEAYTASDTPAANVLEPVQSAVTDDQVPESEMITADAPVMVAEDLTQETEPAHEPIDAVNAPVDSVLSSFVGDLEPLAVSESKDLSEPAKGWQETELLAVGSEKPLPLDDSMPAEAEGPFVGVEDPLLLSAGIEPGFVMASDIDLEMEEFLKEGEIDKSIYSQMRGVRSTRRSRGSVQVTNGRIAAQKALLESSNMQDDSEDGDENFDNLFEEDDDPFKVVGEELPKYRGFEIMIDIREQPVLDLLRFLADQVGFNLYVDRSVGEIKATYKFRNIPWDQALDIILTNANLDKEFRNGVLRVATTEKFRLEEEARAQLRYQRELSVPTETVTVDLNYARARDVVLIVTEYLSPRGSIIRDDRTNILIIRDIPKYMVDIRTLINRLDKRIPQVSIEARIVETTTSFLRELGIQWGLTANYSPETGTDTGVDFPHRIGLGGPRIGLGRGIGGPEGGYAVNLPTVSENAVGFGLTLGNFLDNFKLDISMQLLETEGQGQIISSPKVTTQNNRTALITNGQRVPVQTISRGTVTTRYIDAVLELEVTPQITSDETIIMDLIVDKSEPDFTRASGAGGNPIINISRAETQVLVKNGGTAVIGGIFSLNEQTSNSGLPMLRTIPVLKRLFSKENKTYANQELLIFVTPKIVKY